MLQDHSLNVRKNMRYLRENVIYFTLCTTLFLSRGPISHLTGPKKAKITQTNIAKYRKQMEQYLEKNMRYL